MWSWAGDRRAATRQAVLEDVIVKCEDGRDGDVFIVWLARGGTGADGVHRRNRERAGWVSECQKPVNLSYCHEQIAYHVFIDD